MGQTHKFTETVTAALKNTSAALGVSSGAKFVEADKDKAVKLAANDNYVLCAVDDPIEGFVNSLEAWTVNNGFSFGTVQTGDRKRVQVAAGQTLAVGAFVVAAAQVALGTVGLAQVKAAANLAAAGAFPWRVISLESGVGTAGAIVVIELAGS